MSNQIIPVHLQDSYDSCNLYSNQICLLNFDSALAFMQPTSDQVRNLNYLVHLDFEVKFTANFTAKASLTTIVTALDYCRQVRQNDHIVHCYLDLQ